MAPERKFGIVSNASFLMIRDGILTKSENARSTFMKIMFDSLPLDTLYDLYSYLGKAIKKRHHAENSNTPTTGQ